MIETNTEGIEIVYSNSGPEWDNYASFVQSLVHQYQAKKICDVGGGANPILPIQYINENQLECTILDISSAELAKAPNGYKKLAQDIEANGSIPSDRFDFVFTKMLAEHIKNGKVFHKNIFSMLKQGGIAVHYFPTLYALPFLVNKLVPEKLSSFLLNVFLPRDRFRLGKFPAYYSWCYGPTSGMLNMLTQIGYEIILYKGFFGHIYYSRIPIARDLHKVYTQYLVNHPNPYLTSFAQVVLRKPANSFIK